MTRLPAGPRCATVPEVLRALAAGAPGVIWVVPGWLGPELRRPLVRNLTRAAAARCGPVHARWAWLREDEDGNAETAFWAWPCLTEHRPGFQCQDGRVFHPNTGSSPGSA